MSTEPYDMRETLGRVTSWENLSVDEVTTVSGAIMDGRGGANRRRSLRY
jgi:hypothetical protein